MSNSLVKKEEINSVYGLLQRIDVSMDTSDSALAVAMALGHTPNEYWCVCTSQGTAIVQPDMSFDTVNGEVDFKVTVETGGTIGTHLYSLFLRWYSVAEQDGSSIG